MGFFQPLNGTSQSCFYQMLEFFYVHIRRDSRERRKFLVYLQDMYDEYSYCSIAEPGNYFAQCCGMWIRIRIQELVECGSGSTYV